MSLRNIYNQMVEQDFEKAAQAQVVEEYGPSFANADPDMIKKAADYDYAGRVLAHTVFTDLVKEAVDEEMPYASEDEKKKETDKVVAKAKGEAPAEDEKKDEKKNGEEDEESEKTAALEHAILERMHNDPEYVQALIAKHC
jgi:DNA-directed RNA polymerase beta' subunit